MEAVAESRKITSLAVYPAFHKAPCGLGLYATAATNNNFRICEIAIKQNRLEVALKAVYVIHNLFS
jgi:hypothetical protein